MGSLILEEGLDEKSLIEIGEKAPNFNLKNEKGENWSLSEQLGNVTVLLFYPKNETLVCTRQLCAVRDHWETYLETKASVVGISPATSEEHQEFGKKYKLPLPLLADLNREVTKIFGKHWFYPINFTRAVVVVDANGIIRNQNIMLRAFRPSDNKVIKSIYEARGDALWDKYKNIKKSFWKQKNKHTT